MSKKRTLLYRLVTLLVVVQMAVPAPALARVGPAGEPDAPPQVVAMNPAPGSVLTQSPDALVVAFSTSVLPQSVNRQTFRLVRSGNDGVFGNGNDEVISPPVITLTRPTEAVLDLGELRLPDDVYQVTLVGDVAALNNKDAEVLALELSGALLPSATLQERIRDDLAAIRRTSPPMTSIHARPPWTPGELLVGLTAEAWQAHLDGRYHGLDDLNAQYGPVEIDPLMFAELLVLRFEQPYNPKYLARLYATAEGVRYAVPNNIYGDGDDIEVYGPYYTFRARWGDCPAGCIFFHNWVFSVEEGAAILVSEYGTPLAAPLLPSVITDLEGNPLDGEFQGTFPSGDGVAGGDFRATFVVAGAMPSVACPDVADPPGVEVEDLLALAERWQLTALDPDPDDDPATANYELRLDLDADGAITVRDIAIVAARWQDECR